MLRRCKQTNRDDESPRRRALRRQHGLTLVELLVAMTIVLMVVGAMGGLARTSQQAFEYSEGYGIATQYARVALDRISQNVCQATANEQFPGCIVVAESVNAYRYPDTLVVWRPTGTAAAPNGLPLYNELIIYCPSPAAPNQLVEMTAPNDTRTVPAATDEAAWQTALTALKGDAGTKSVVLCTLLRTCSTSSSGTNLRGDLRFETRLRPSAADWTSYTSGSVSWMNLPWVQGIYGSRAGLRQVWARIEMQLTPWVDLVASGTTTASAVPYLGSAALYYELNHP